MRSFALATALLSAPAFGFQHTFAGVGRQSMSTTSLNMEGSSDRRGFLNQVVIAGVATGLVALGDTKPANAFGGFDRVNGQLKSYGLPPLKSVPDGFSPLLELWGKGKNRSPLLVQFAHPSDWVVTLPSQDVNGEDGTIQAGQYSAGDTATLYVIENTKVENISEQPKTFFKDSIIKAISQKGDNIYQDFKVTNLETKPGEIGGQQYGIVDFKYTLITGAGFEVDRVGVASVTSVGNAVEVLWCASTRQRYKKLENKLRDIAGSFRVYSDGLNFSEQLVRTVDDAF